MNDRFVEVTHQSWGSRLIDSVKGVLIGIVLFLASFPLLWWNEGRAAQTASSLKEGLAAVVSIPPDPVNAANEGKLVHVTALASTQESLLDSGFGVSAQALRLMRAVQLFQWVEERKTETRKNLGGSEEKVTTYSYNKQWKDSVVASDEFKQPEGHSNPRTMPYPAIDVVARNASLGSFHLPEEVIRKVSVLDAYQLDARAVARLPGNLAGKARVTDGAFYIGTDPTSPQIGDVRVSYRVLPVQALSVVARQTANSFQPYHAKAGDDVLLIERGSKDAPTMFQTAQDANTTLTWILRLAGFLLMAVGLTLILRPLVVVADFIPMIGSFASFSASVFSVLVALPLSLLVIAVAWIAVRPLLGIVVLAAALAGFVLMGAVATLAYKRRKRARTAGV